MKPGGRRVVRVLEPTLFYHVLEVKSGDGEPDVLIPLWYAVHMSHLETSAGCATTQFVLEHEPQPAS